MIYLLMFCSSIHGIDAQLHSAGPECKVISVHKTLLGAIVAGGEHCRGENGCYEMTEAERECRQHLWAQELDLQ